MKIIKKKLNEDQIKARRRNKIILESEIADTKIEVDQNQFMLDNQIAEKRIRKQLVLAKSKLESLEQNLAITEKELKHGCVEIEEQEPQIIPTK